MDQASLARLNQVYPDVRVGAFRVYEDMRRIHRREMKCCQGLRSFEDQAAIWAKGRVQVNGVWQYVDPVHHAGVVTYAEPGDSWHHYSAIDSCFAGDDPWLEKVDPREAEFLWSEYAKFGRGHGFTAGFDWAGKKKDRPHLEKTYGLSLAEVKALHARGGLTSVWARFDGIRGVRVASEWHPPLVAPEATV